MVVVIITNKGGLPETVTDADSKTLNVKNLTETLEFLLKIRR